LVGRATRAAARAITAVLASPRGHQYLDYAGGDREFAALLQVADTIWVRRFGLSIFDIADWARHVAYEAGDRPRGPVGAFLMAHHNTRRPTDVTARIAEAICHVARDSREHAEWLATFTVGEHGRPTSAVKAWAATTPERHTICPTARLSTTVTATRIRVSSPAGSRRAPCTANLTGRPAR
jgi:hypothetical protein